MSQGTLSSPRARVAGRRATRAIAQWLNQAQTANSAVLAAWFVTRLVLVAGMVIGARYCDPAFYNYAGQLAVGHLPYRDVPVEYPPLALVLILLPALPLLPFAGIGPRPDPAFQQPFQQLPHPDIVRYSAYGLSFGVEMLIVDMLTLWLVRAAARRLVPGDRYGARAGLLYIGLVFASGALLQKFDLVVGSLCLAAIVAVLLGHARLGWVAIGLAALIKGFPLLLVPLLLGAVIARALARDESRRWRSEAWRALREACVWIGGTLAVVMLPVLLLGGLPGIGHSLNYQAGRGTEIESLYSNVQLALGWLPGMHVITAFHAADLSRVVRSSLDYLSDPASTILLVAGVAVCYVLCFRLLRRWLAGAREAGRGVAPATRAEVLLGAQRTLGMLVLGASAAVLLVFLLAFRALPAHYLLIVIPLACVVRFAEPRATLLFRGAVLAVALLGQVLAMPTIWAGLVDLAAGPVVLLSARNLLWLSALGLVAGALLGRSAGSAEHHVGGGSIRAAGDSRVLTSVRRSLASVRAVIAAAPPVPGFAPRAEDVLAHLFSRVSALRVVVLAGTGSAVLYLGLVLEFPITRLWNHPHIAGSTSIINDMGHITDYSPVVAMGFVVTILSLFLLQFLATVAAARTVESPVAADVRGVDAMPGVAPSPSSRAVHRAILLFPILFVVIMVWMQPVTTTDLYGYVARGYLWVFGHANPMTTPATQLPGGLVVDRPAAPYGPAWLLIAGTVARLAGNNLFANMFAFKLIEAVATIGTILLVDRLALRLVPERRLHVDILFGWSPLLLFEAIGNGHNDIVMMLCVMAAWLLMLRGYVRLPFALLVIGALIKYVAAVFVPLWLIYELYRMPSERRATLTESASGALGWVQGELAALLQADWRRAVNLLLSAFVIGVVLVGLCYAPFWQGIRTFTGLGQQLRPLYYNDSIVAFVTAPLQLVVAPSHYAALDKTVRLVCYAIFGAYLVVLLRRMWLRGSAITGLDVITAAAKITFAALIIITFWFQPWYVVWLLPLAALAAEPTVRWQAMVLALGALMTYAVSNFLFVNETGLGQALFVQFFEILVTFGPLLALRMAPQEGGLSRLLRRSTLLVGSNLSRHAAFWEGVMLGLVMVVAVLLRLLRLGNLFASLTAADQSGAVLNEVSGSLALVLSDTQGLSAPFIALHSLLTGIFGPTTFAALLPSAIFGSLTVLVIYGLTLEIMRQGGWRGGHSVGLLAALLAATSRWHVSLSRSGMQVVLMPLLVCLALYLLLVAFRLGADVAQLTGAGVDGMTAGDQQSRQLRVRRIRFRRRLLFAACGVCTGLACDLAPGLWLLPLLVAGFLVVWRWLRPQWFTHARLNFAVLIGSAVVSGVPAIGVFLSRGVGFPAGSPVLARTSVQTTPGPSIFDPVFWAQVARNLQDVLHLLVNQDYSAGYPAAGSTPIVPVLLAPAFFLGAVILLVRWRSMSALALMLLVAMPLVASVAVGTPTSVIEAASVLPAICIVPALALYEAAAFLGHLPIAFDRLNGARVFSTPAQIGRLLLLTFLLVSAIRTFYWCFEATLPAAPPNQYTPSYVVPHGGVVRHTARDGIALPVVTRDGVRWVVFSQSV